MRRIRFSAVAATALAAGLVPAAPLPAAQSGPGVWRPTYRTVAGLDNLSAFADGTAYASLGMVPVNEVDLLPAELRPVSEGPGYLKSLDHGQTWLPMPAPPVRPGISGTVGFYVRFATPTVGYATYQHRVRAMPGPGGTVSRDLCRGVSHTYRTTDGGQTWSPLCEPQSARGGQVDVGFSPLGVGRDPRVVVLTGSDERVREGQCDADMSHGVVHLSTDGGASWRRGALPRSYGPGWSTRVFDSRTAALIAYNYRYRSQPNECHAIGERNAVFLTSDGGRTYRRVLTCAKQPLCTSVAFVTKNRMIVGTTDGTTYVSTNGGRTWREGQRLYDVANEEAVRSQPDRRWWHWVQSFSFADAKTGYASTRGAGTWRTTDGGESWVQELSHECTYHQFGIGENAAATPDRALTGGPAFISARIPTPVGPGTCHPDTGNDAVAAPVVAAGGVTVLPDGSLRR